MKVYRIKVKNTDLYYIPTIVIKGSSSSFNKTGKLYIRKPKIEKLDFKWLFVHKDYVKEFPNVNYITDGPEDCLRYLIKKSDLEIITYNLIEEEE